MSNDGLDNFMLYHLPKTEGRLVKRMLFSFAEQVLKNGILNEVTRRNTKGKEHITYGIVNMCRYYDKYLDKVVDIPVKIAVGYDEDSKKYVLSASDFE